MRLLRQHCVYRQVDGVDDRDRLDFARLYALVGSQENLVWVYRNDDVMDVLWRENAPHCIRTVRDPDGLMIGIACCHPFVEPLEPKVHGWVEAHELPFPANKAVIISCLMVHPSARGNGIAMSLGYECLHWAARAEFEYFMLQASVAIVRRPAGLCERLDARSVAKLQGAQEDRNHIVLAYGRMKDALAGAECNH
ncbi:GNAT family N-acetyltransferase [Candidatus Uhrbacteria bacterium]|nr:GNAT family N-acetyltransferase [Candidatus Uhrbacteria bacterium]